MPLEDRDKALLYDMLDATRHLVSIWQSRTLKELLADRTLQWATDRGFNIVGEAARRVSDATKAANLGLIGGGSSVCGTWSCTIMTKSTTRVIGT